MASTDSISEALNLVFFSICMTANLLMSACVGVLVCVCVCSGAYRQSLLFPISHDTAVFSPPHLLLSGFQLNKNPL